MDSVLITGASGLLGSELVKLLSEMELQIIGQFHNKKPPEIKNCRWVYGDFTDLNSIKAFLKNSHKYLEKAVYFINLYGPITYKNIRNLETIDYQNDFFSNAITPIEITNYLLKSENRKIKSIINIGFELTGKIKPVRNVLPYMMAKNALLEYTVSMAKQYKGIRFNMISPITIEGAEIASKNGKKVSSKTVAEIIIKTLFEKKSGENIFVKI